MYKAFKKIFYIFFMVGVLVFSIHIGVKNSYANLVTSDLWIRAVINTVEKGSVEAVWKKGGEATTSRGDRVIWGHFYASPSDVTWGSENNPDLFVKIWFDVSGRVDVNYFHVSVPDIQVYSDYPYDGTADQQGTTSMSRRYIRQYYQDGQSYSEENYEDGNPPSGYSPNGNPSGYSTINDLKIGNIINTVEKGSIDAVWRLGGQDTTSRGDQVVWGLFYASPSDVTWGSQNNPDLFVKIWFDVSGRVDVNFFHVSVPDIEVYSDLPNEGAYDQKGTTVMNNRYIRHEYWVSSPTCSDTDSDDYYAEDGCGTAVDCNDNDASINPGTTEICDDGKDNDCDGNTDLADTDCSSDPYTNTGGLSGTWKGGMYPGNGIDFEVEEINGENYVISASGWYVAIGCINEHYSWEANDLQNKIVNNECHIYFPDDLNFGDGRGMELHIYFDSDTELHGTWVGETFCDPLIEGTLRAYHCIDKDNDGYDACNECDDDNADINRDADEICDGVDNDCDGKIDEGLFYPDKDNDGYGDILDVGQSCPVPEGYVSDNTDCNDNDSTINPGAVEIPGDGIDQNCDERFTIMGDGTVRDPRTGLIWLKDASCSELAGTDEYGKANWDVATAAAAALADGTCGLTDGSSAGDWRLPTSSEFSGLVARKYRYPDLSNTAGTAQWSEGDPFNGVESGWHWSATDMIGEMICRDSQGQPEGSVNCMYMGTGDVRYHSASDYFCKQIRNFQVWPVRSDN